MKFSRKPTDIICSTSKRQRAWRINKEEKTLRAFRIRKWPREKDRKTELKKDENKIKSCTRKELSSDFNPESDIGFFFGIRFGHLFTYLLNVFRLKTEKPKITNFTEWQPNKSERAKSWKKKVNLAELYNLKSKCCFYLYFHIFKNKKKEKNMNSGKFVMRNLNRYDILPFISVIILTICSKLAYQSIFGLSTNYFK